MATKIVPMDRMNQIVKIIAPILPHASRTSSAAKNRASAYRMLGAVMATRIAMMTPMRRIARKKNAMRGCSLAATADASTTHGAVVSVAVDASL